MEIVTLGDVELPVAVRGVPSKGEAVSAPLTPNATAAALDEPVKVIVIVIVPLEGHTAYHVSKCLDDENGTLALCVQVKLGLEVMPLTV